MIGNIRVRPLTLIAVCCLSVVLVGVSVTLWPHHEPQDYEECLDLAKRTINESASSIAECSAKFAGRRKVGGGYAYYDFLQNRSFDIAGPNPSPEEQKQIDREYVIYLAAERRKAIAEDLAKKQNEEALVDQERAQQAQLSPGRSSSIGRNSQLATMILFHVVGRSYQRK